MSYTQHVHSSERDRAQGILRLHATDESILSLLRRYCLSAASTDTRDGTVSQAMAAGNRLRHRVLSNQIDDVRWVPVPVRDLGISYVTVPS